MTETIHLMSEATLKIVHRRSVNSRNTLTGLCGCFHCPRTFMTKCVTDWIDAGQTAPCPVCGIDAVLSSTPTLVTSSLPQQMRNHWFETHHSLSPVEWDQGVATDGHPRAP